MKTYVDTAELKLPKFIEHEFKEFCRGIIETYQDECLSITVYGSVARHEYFPERSDVNTLVVLERADLETLKRVVDVVHKARAGCKVTPFFMTPDDIRTSTDVFPIKFYDMKDHYHVVYGKDVLKDLNISDDHLRLELEQEMKILMLELRQFYVQRAKRGGGAGADHLLAYFNSFLYLIKRLMILQGRTPPTKNEDLVHETAKTYNFDIDLLKRMLAYKTGKPMKDAVGEALPFFKIVSKSADLIDKLLVA
ncbi:MAG: hypothetical protein ACYS22_01755 [Planctomycetota bacterium]|jgi:predicted nucleotidyltransferase